jgi:hypothetical protein
MAEYTPHADVEQMIRERDFVLRKYTPMFSPGAVSRVSASEFTDFLKFENNRHWWGLRRHSERITANMDLLRWALETLFDNDRPITQRIDEIDPVDGRPVIPGFDRSIYTPVLLMSSPEEYGVWSSISEAAMKRLELWPVEEERKSNGACYGLVNEMLVTIAEDARTDLWTLDALWWAIEKEHDPGSHFRTRRAPERTTASTRSKATSSRPRATPRKPPRPTATTFLCETCFQQKPINLVSDDPRLCVDCA